MKKLAVLLLIIQFSCTNTTSDKEIELLKRENELLRKEQELANKQTLDVKSPVIAKSKKGYKTTKSLGETYADSTVGNVEVNLSDEVILSKIKKDLIGRKMRKGKNEWTFVSLNEISDFTVLKVDKIDRTEFVNISSVLTDVYGDGKSYYAKFSITYNEGVLERIYLEEYRKL